MIAFIREIKLKSIYILTKMAVVNIKIINYMFLKNNIY